MISYTNRCPLSTCHWVRVCLWCLQMAQTAAETMIDADNPLWAPGCLRYKANAPPVRSTRPANIQRLDKTPLTAGTYLPTLHSNHPHPPTLCHLLLKRWIFRYCTIISCMLPLSFSLHLFFDAWYNFFMGGGFIEHNNCQVLGWTWYAGAQNGPQVRYHNKKGGFLDCLCPGFRLCSCSCVIPYCVVLSFGPVQTQNPKLVFKVLNFHCSRGFIVPGTMNILKGSVIPLYNPICVFIFLSP